mgnify:CR=1 FL=1
MTSTKTGTSALALKQVLGLGSYQTAWTWLHKLRRAMIRPGRDRLSGRVEVDETFVGGGGAQGRSTATKALVVVAAEEVGRGIGRIRMRRVPDGKAKTLQAFIDDVIEPGSEAYTPMDGTATNGSRPALTIVCRSFADTPQSPPNCCHGSTAWSRCSNAGCSAPIKAP